MFARIRFLATPWLWLGLSLAIWALGVGDRDLYALPGLVGLVLLGVWLRTGDLKGLWKKVAAFPGRQHKLVLAGYAGLATVFVATTVLKLYSFRWSVFDVGIYSNVVFHYEQGQVHSSFLGMSAWADHFTPSLAVLAPGFWIIPSAHWLTLGKCVAYLVTPLLVWWWLRQVPERRESARPLAVAFGGLWLLFYAPAVNSRIFEFSPSSLAPPLIVVAFALLERQRWIWLIGVLLLLLGLKEHLAVVAMGLGLWLLPDSERRKEGLLLIAGGLILYLMIFQIMPYFPDYIPGENDKIAPFEHLVLKAKYLVKLLWPLLLAPGFGLRVLLLCSPAMVINLASGRPEMVSTGFHYDDLASTLLLLGVVREWSSRAKDWQTALPRFWRWRVGLAALLLMVLLPSGPLRELWASLPQDHHLKLAQELRRADQETSGQWIAVQDALGPHLHRAEITRLVGSETSCGPLETKETQAQFLFLAPKVGHYQIQDLEACLSSLDQDAGYARIEGYNELVVYRRVEQRS